MVAKTRPIDWRYVRAIAVVEEWVRTKLPIRYSDYFEEFDMDEDELDALFNTVALNMQLRVQVLPTDPPLH